MTVSTHTSNISEIIGNTLALQGHTGTPTPQLEPVVLREVQIRDTHTVTGVSDLVLLPYVNTEGPPRILVLTRPDTSTPLSVTRVIRLGEDLATNYSWYRALGSRLVSGSNLSVVGDRSFSGVMRYVVYHSLPNYRGLLDNNQDSVEMARSPDLPYGTHVSLLTPPPLPMKSSTRSPLVNKTSGVTYVGAASTGDTAPGGVSERRENVKPTSYLFESRGQAASTAFPWNTSTTNATLTCAASTTVTIMDVDLLTTNMLDNPITSMSLAITLPRMNVVTTAVITGVVSIEVEYLADEVTFGLNQPVASVLEFSGAVAGSYGYAGTCHTVPRLSWLHPISRVRVLIRNNTNASLDFVRPNQVTSNYQALEILDHSVVPPLQAIIYEGLDPTLTHNLFHDFRCLLELAPNPVLSRLVTPVNFSNNGLNYQALTERFRTGSTLALMGGRESYEGSRQIELKGAIGVSGVYEVAGTAMGLAADWFAPEFSSGLKRGLCATEDPPENPPPPEPADTEPEPTKVPGHEEGKVGLCMDAGDEEGVDIPLDLQGTPAEAGSGARVPNLASNAEDTTLKRVTDSLVRGDRKATVRSLRQERGFYHCSNRFAYLVDGRGMVGTIALSDAPPRGDYVGKPVATVDDDGIRTVIHSPPIFENFAPQMKAMVQNMRPEAGTQSLTNGPNLYVQVYAPGVVALEQESWQLAFAACLAALPISAVLAGRVEPDGKVTARLSSQNALAKLQAANGIGLPLITSAEQFKSGPKSPGPDLVLLRDHDVTPVAMGLANLSMLVIYAMIVNAPKPVVKKDTNFLLGGTQTVLQAGSIIPSAARPVAAAQNTPQTTSSEPLELEIPDVFVGVVGSDTLIIDGPQALQRLVDKIASVKGNRDANGKALWRPSYEKFFKKYPYNNATGGEPIAKSLDPALRRTDSYVMRASEGTADGETLPSLQIALNSIADQTRSRSKKGTTPLAMPKAKQAAAQRLQNVAFDADDLF